MSESSGAGPPGGGNVPSTNNNAQSAWYGALVVIFVVPTVLVALRVYTKQWLLRQWSLADWATCVGWILLVATWSIALDTSKYGIGSHMSQVNEQDFDQAARGLSNSQAVYMPAIFFAKAAVLLQLRDVFVLEKYNRRWWTIWGLIVANAVFYILAMFLEVFYCNPREKAWNPTLPGSCIDIEGLFTTTGSVNAIDDLLILLLASVWTWKLQVTQTHKLRALALFATGIFACVCSIVRSYYTSQAASGSDLSSTAVPTTLWSLAEISSTLVVVCLPTMARLFRRWSDTSREKSRNGTDAPRGSVGTHVNHNDLERYPSESDSDLSKLGPEEVQGIRRTDEIKVTLHGNQRLVEGIFELPTVKSPRGHIEVPV